MGRKTSPHSRKTTAVQGTSRPLAADVVVVGGGHAGCTLTALLAAQGIKTVCIDQDDPALALTPAFDGRTTAISAGSASVLTAAGIWDDALLSKACPIRNIDIRETGSPTLLRFLSEDAGSEAFGWIIENRYLRQRLFERLSRLADAEHFAPARVTGFQREEDGIRVILNDGRTIKSSLVVGADGRKSFTREWMGIGTRGWDYGQKAIVCIVEHEQPHNHIAVEDFRPQGPFAILPMHDDEKGHHRSSIVWTEHGQETDSALLWDDAAFNAGLQERFPDFYGRVRLAGKRFSYPLNLVHAHRYTIDRMALIADAAHGIHPIAGQGLNMGMRDIAVMAELLIDAHAQKQDLGSPELLQQYERRRRLDNMSMAGATDMLNKLFSNPSASLGALRRAGLKIVQKIPAVRLFFMKQAMGSASHLSGMMQHSTPQDSEKRSSTV